MVAASQSDGFRLPANSQTIRDLDQQYGPILISTFLATFIKVYSESCRIIDCVLISGILYFGIFIRHCRIPIVMIYRPHRVWYPLYLLISRQFGSICHKCDWGHTSLSEWVIFIPLLEVSDWDLVLITFPMGLAGLVSSEALFRALRYDVIVDTLVFSWVGAGDPFRRSSHRGFEPKTIWKSSG